MGGGGEIQERTRYFYGIGDKRTKTQEALLTSTFVVNMSDANENPPSEENEDSLPEESESPPEEDPVENKADAEDEDELTDPQDTLRLKCAARQDCYQLGQEICDCAERVNSRTKTLETCEQELYDFMHCVDKCVAKELFSFLK